jgi:hypothetical protein
VTINLVDARVLNGKAVLFLAPTGRPVFAHRGADGEDGGADDGDEGDNEEDGDSEDDDADKGDADKSGDDKAKKDSKKRTIDPDEYDAQVAHKDRLKNQLREADKKRDAAEKELTRLKNESLPDKEKAAAELTEITKERDDYKSRFTNLARTNAFLTASARAGVNWHDPEDAQSVGRKELAELTISDDGEVDGIDTLVKDLAKRKPHLVKAAKTEGEDKDGKEDKGRKTNGATGSGVGSRSGKGKSNNGALSNEELMKRFPALRK